MRKIFLSFILMLWAGILSAETFVKVTDVASLNNGDKILFVCEANGKVNAGFISSYKAISGTTASISGGKVTLDSYTAITLTASGSNWTMTLGSSKIGHKDSKDLDTNRKTSTVFSIAISGGDATITSQSNTSYIWKNNNNDGRFALYTSSSSGVSPIQIYKLDEGSLPENAVTSVTLNKNEAKVRLGTPETLSATITTLRPEQGDDVADKSLAWGSTDESIATVANGVVTAKAIGSAKIWVKATAVANVSDTCTVQVLPKAATGNATWNAVQKAEYLPDGAMVFFGSPKSSENYVMGQYVSGKNISGSEATYGSGRHSVTAPLQSAYTVHIEEDGKYVFVDHDGQYLSCGGDSRLTGSWTKEAQCRWILGEFDQDDATVMLKNAYYTSSYYLLNNHNANLFACYGGVGDGANLSKIILYSDEAPEWVERVKNPWMQVASTVIDWGKAEPVEGYTDYWSEARYVELTMNDLPGPIQVELTNDGNGTFSCYTSTISAGKTSEKFLISWTTEQKGKYEGELTLTCTGLETIRIQLLAESVDEYIDPATLPQFSASANKIYLNPNQDVESSDFGKDQATFTFSACNLAKALYCKIHHDTQLPWFVSGEEKITVTIAGTDYLVNDKPNLGTDDRTDEPVTISVYAYNPGLFRCELNFYSLKADSKEDRAIDVTIPVIINVSEQPEDDPTGLEKVQRDDVRCTKVIENGVLYLLYEGQMYDVRGVRIGNW
jgi:hypothetical protein